MLSTFQKLTNYTKEAEKETNKQSQGLGLRTGWVLAKFFIFLNLDFY
jgi:hypothetical protein